MELEMAAAGRRPRPCYDCACEETGPMRDPAGADHPRRAWPISARRTPASAISVKLPQHPDPAVRPTCATEFGGQRGLNRVVLSGGVFQNARLLAGLIPALDGRGASRSTAIAGCPPTTAGLR
ncbi:MAG: hypothetical protein MZV70_48915 [Desulfobacterales bacterium]|nr:hypothetical protein [Desulfobacterales bacterium]